MDEGHRHRPFADRRRAPLDRIVFGAGGIVEPTEFLGDLTDRRILDPRAIVELTHRDVLIRFLDPPERDVVAMQESHTPAVSRASR
jgi:hypothetical protein